MPSRVLIFTSETGGIQNAPNGLRLTGAGLSIRTVGQGGYTLRPLDDIVIVAWSGTGSSSSSSQTPAPSSSSSSSSLATYYVCTPGCVPDCSGTYLANGTAGGRTKYVRDDDGYCIWWTDSWHINAGTSPNPEQPFWEAPEGEGMENSYAPQNGAVGTPVVSDDPCPEPASYSSSSSSSSASSSSSSSSTPVGLTLPAASGGGKTYYVKSTISDPVVLSAAGSDDIDGSPSRTLSQWDCLCVADGAAGHWYVLCGV